jgi:uncharacterized protein YndB with AHSA1/START domain
VNGPLRREVHIEAPLEVVHRYFTDPVRLTEWWPSEATIDARPKGTLLLRFVRPDGARDVARGEFIELSARRIVFTWGFEGDAELGPGVSRVEVTLEPDATGTVVRLEHHGLPEDRRVQHDQGWAHFLGRLREVAGLRP